MGHHVKDTAWHIANGWRSNVNVDTLKLGVRLDYEPKGVRLLDRCLSKAREAYAEPPNEDEAAELEAGGGDSERAGQLEVFGVACKLHAGRKFYPLILTTGDFSVELSWKKLKASEQQAPGALVTFRAAALAELGHEVLVQRFLRWSRAFGAQGSEPIVSRLDLALDLASSEPSMEWVRRDQLVTSASVNRVRFGPKGEDPVYQTANAALAAGFGARLKRAEVPAMDLFETEFIRERRRLTSINIGTRGRESVYLRLYDKVLQARKAQLAHVEPHWRKQGWDGTPGVRGPDGKVYGTIWRAEFEMGRDWLRRHGIDTYEHLRNGGVQEVWAFLTRRWLRVVEDDRGTGVLDDRGRALGAVRREERPCVPFWYELQKGSGAARPVERVPDLEPRVPLSLMESCAGTFALLAAGRGWSRRELVYNLVTVGLKALQKVPEKLEAMSVEGQHRLGPGEVWHSLAEVDRDQLVAELLATEDKHRPRPGAPLTLTCEACGHLNDRKDVKAWDPCAKCGRPIAGVPF